MEANRDKKRNKYINHTYRIMLSLMQCSDNVVTYVYLKYVRIGIRAKKK